MFLMDLEIKIEGMKEKLRKINSAFTWHARKSEMIRTEIKIDPASSAE